MHWDEQTPADVSISDLCLIDASGHFSARGNVPTTPPYILLSHHPNIPHSSYGEVIVMLA